MIAAEVKLWFVVKKCQMKCPRIWEQADEVARRKESIAMLSTAWQGKDSCLHEQNAVKAADQH